MPTDSDDMQLRIEQLEDEVAALKQAPGHCGVRKTSSTRVLGMPLYDIAMGPDSAAGETRGHARGFIAIGDIATGVVALGGMARGVVACGGLALGAITLGGCSFGLLLAIGGLAVGGIALGGGAIGVVAVGGGAYGYYACGGGAYGEHVLSGMEQDPEAVRFFREWIPGIDKMIRAKPN